MRRPKHKLRNQSCLALATVGLLLVSGCARFTVPPTDTDSRSRTSVVTKDSSDGLGSHEVGPGMTILQWGDKKNNADRNAALSEADPEYAEYLEWKRWQEFKAYREWKAQQASANGES